MIDQCKSIPGIVGEMSSLTSQNVAKVGEVVFSSVSIQSSDLDGLHILCCVIVSNVVGDAKTPGLALNPC